MRYRSVQGSVFIELAIALPTLFLLFLASFDLGRALTEYLRLVRVSYEVSRIASSVIHLPEGRYESGQEHSEQQVQRIMNRLQTLMTTQGFPQYSATLEVAENSERSQGSCFKSVQFTVEAPFRSYLLFFTTLPLNVDMSGPYLFPDETCASDQEEDEEEDEEQQSSSSAQESSAESDSKDEASSVSSIEKASSVSSVSSSSAQASSASSKQASSAGGGGKTTL